MRIIQITHEFPPSIGGQGLHVYSLSKELAKRGHEVTVLTTNLVDTWDTGKISDRHFEHFDGFDVYRCKVHFRFKNYMVSSQLTRKLFGNHADLIHTHGYSYFHSDATALISKMRKIPFILTSHAFYPALYPFSKMILGAYNSLVGRIELCAASKCIALTPYYAKIFRELGVPKDKIQVIPNGINIKHYSDLPDPSPIISKYGIDGKLITFIGRLDDIKSPALVHLIKAFKILLSDYPKLKLAILGPDWGYLSSLRKLARDLGIRHSVIFTGKVSEQEKLMFLSKSAIGVVVSLDEAFSLVLLEFMVCGKPIIASRVGGLKFVVKDGLIGYLTDNNPRSMERKLRKILSNETLAKEIGEKGRKLATSTYDWSKVVDRLENVYTECQR